jgi:hypothetical protein
MSRDMETWKHGRGGGVQGGRGGEKRKKGEGNRLFRFLRRGLRMVIVSVFLVFCVLRRGLREAIVCVCFVFCFCCVS